MAAGAGGGQAAGAVGRDRAAPTAQIVFTRTVKEGSKPNLYVIAADGSGGRLFVRNASDASVSKDGRRIAFERDGAVWSMRRDGSQQRQLTRPGGRPADPAQIRSIADYSPAWSVDGRNVYFSREEAQALPTEKGAWSMSIFSVRSDGTGLRHLTTAAPTTQHGVCHDDPAPSPDGRIVAYDFTGDCDHTPGGIAAVNVVGGPAPMLSGFPYAQVWRFDPAWSPDGRRLAFVTMDVYGVENYPGDGIYTTRPDGSQARLLTKAAGASAPQWSPDGTWLAYTSYAGEVTIVRADGSGIRRVTRTKIQERDVAWLPRIS